MQSTYTPGDPGVVAAWWHQRCGDLHNPGRPASCCVNLPWLAASLAMAGRTALGASGTRGAGGSRSPLPTARTSLTSPGPQPVTPATSGSLQPSALPRRRPWRRRRPSHRRRLQRVSNRQGACRAWPCCQQGSAQRSRPGRLQEVPGHNTMPLCGMLEQHLQWLLAGAR